MYRKLFLDILTSDICIFKKIAFNIRKLDKGVEPTASAELYAKNQMEKQIFEEKFERLYLQMGKKVAWNFATQYNKMRNEGSRAEKLWKKTKGVVRTHLIS